MRRLVVFLSLFLIGCQLPQKVEVQKTEIQITTKIQDPQPIHLRPINWDIINYNNEMFIGLTPKEYENLSYNMLQLRKFIQEQNYIINTYKELNKENKHEKF